MTEVARLDVVVNTDRANQSLRSFQREAVKTDTVTSKAVKRTGSSFDRLKGKILSTKGALAGFGAGLAIRKVVGTIGGFEKAMSGVQAVTQATGDSFDNMSKKARELGASTVFSATEAAEGMRFLGQAGFDTDEIIQSIEPSLKLAQAGMLGLGEAADIVSNIMSGFRLEADATAAVGDILAATARSSNTDIRQLGEGMKFVAPIAAATGQDIRQVAAAMGVLGDAGLQGSQGGTLLRIAMLKLLDASSDAEASVESLGLKMSDLNPETESLSDIINRLADANIGATEAAEIFGARGATAILALTGATPRLAELEEKTRNATGALDEMSRVMSDNIPGAFKAMTSAMTESTLIMGDRGLKAAIRGLIDGTTNLVRAFNGVLDPLDEANRKFFILADTLKVIGVAAAGFTFGKITNSLIAGTQAAFNMAKALRAMTLAQIGLNIAMLANPIGLVIGTIAAIVGALYVFRNKTLEIGGVTSTVGDIIATVWDRITVPLKMFGLMLDIVKEDTSEKLAAMAEFIKPFVDIWLSSVKGVLNFWIATGKSIIDYWAGVLKAVVLGVSGLSKDLSTRLSDIGKGIKASLNPFSDEDASAFFERAIGRPLETGITASLEETAAKIKDNYKTDFVGGIVEVTKEGLVAGAKVVGDAVDRLGKDAGDRYLARTADAAEAAVDKAGTAARTIEEMLKSGSGGTIETEGGPSNDISTAIRDLEFELAQLGKATDLERQVAEAFKDLKISDVTSKDAQAIRTLITAIDAETVSMERRNRQAEIAREVTMGATEDMAAAATQLTDLKSLYDQGAISIDQFAQKAREANQALREAKVAAGEGSFTDGFISQLESSIAAAESWKQEIGTILGSAIDPLIDGFSNATAEAVLFGEGAGDAMKQLGKQVLTSVVGSLIKLGVQMVMNTILGKTLAGAATAASIAEAAIISAAWATPAALVAGATFGASAVTGTAAVATSIAATQAMAAIPGAAEGGHFTVGGRSGRDKNVVPLRLSQGEDVLIRTPAQQRARGSGGGGGVAFHIDARGAAPGTAQELRQVMEEFKERAVREAVEISDERIGNFIGRGST